MELDHMACIIVVLLHERLLVVVAGELKMNVNSSSKVIIGITQKTVNSFPRSLFFLLVCL